MVSLDEAQRDGIVIGLKQDGQEPLPRLDVDKYMHDDQDGFNLMLLAFMELMGKDVPWPNPNKVDNKDKMSWYQIAGIHGMPLQNWDGENGRHLDLTNEDPGYCAHGTPHFGPWHRPYLAMLEQTLFHRIKSVADRFNQSSHCSDQEKKAYTEAAKRFRLPYWDYFRPRNNPIKPNTSSGSSPYDFSAPQIFTVPQIMVKVLPTNELKLMENPLFKYDFSWNSVGETLNKDEWDNSGLPGDMRSDAGNALPQKRTFRHFNPKSSKDNFDEMNEDINTTLKRLKDSTLRLALIFMEEGPYANYQVFGYEGLAMTNPKFKDFAKEFDDALGSLEALHGNYHVMIGGAGHMGHVPVAAFDPIFWFHHCQIDRLLAIWQAVNPGHWYNDLKRGVDDNDPTAPQLPFRASVNTGGSTPWNYWTPDMCKETTVLGYTYPDIAKGTGDAAKIRATYKRNYSWARLLTPEGHYQDPPPEMEVLDLSKVPFFKYPQKPVGFRPLSKKMTLQARAGTQETLMSVKPADALKKSREWYIDIILERMALNGGYTVFYFLGDIPADPTQWLTAPTMAGIKNVFAAPVAACDNCGRHEAQAHLISDTDPITSYLFYHIYQNELASMEPEDVKPFLVKNLKWRVLKSNGEVINPRRLDENNTFALSISCKVAPLPGQQGEVTYETYTEVIREIIANSS